MQYHTIPIPPFILPSAERMRKSHIIVSFFLTLCPKRSQTFWQATLITEKYGISTAGPCGSRCLDMGYDGRPLKVASPHPHGFLLMLSASLAGQEHSEN